MVAALAGCSETLTGETVVEEEAHDGPREPPAEATTDFEVRSLRAAGEDPFVGVGDAGDQPTGRRHFVLDAEDAAALRFDVDHERADAIREFVTATDFDERSVVVHQRQIDDCYERHVEYVTARADRYRAQFCRELRDATTRCEADETQMEAIFLRIPYAYDSPPSRRGSGERGRCDYGGRPAPAGDES